jgi:hypothetical protein
MYLNTIFPRDVAGSMARTLMKQNERNHRQTCNLLDSNARIEKHLAAPKVPSAPAKTPRKRRVRRARRQSAPTIVILDIDKVKKKTLRRIGKLIGE